MNIVLTIEADSFDEIAHLFSVGIMIPAEKEPVRVTIPEPPEVEPETVAEETPAPKKGRSRKAAAPVEAEAGSSGEAETKSDAPADGEPVTFADLRAKTDEILQAGKVDSRAIQQMLIEKFDAKAFGQVKEEDYARCLDELDKLAA